MSSCPGAGPRSLAYGLLALLEIEQRLGVARRFAECIDDPRSTERIRRGLADMLRFLVPMIAAGYEDGNHADSLRHDTLFQLANGRLLDEAPLCWQPTLSRLENTPGTRALCRTARTVVAHDCASTQTFPRECRAKLHSIKLIDGLNSEIKRRTDVVGIFPSA